MRADFKTRRQIMRAGMMSPLLLVGCGSDDDPGSTMTSASGAETGTAVKSQTGTPYTSGTTATGRATTSTTSGVTAATRSTTTATGTTSRTPVSRLTGSNSSSTTTTTNTTSSTSGSSTTGNTASTSTNTTTSNSSPATNGTCSWPSAPAARARANVRYVSQNGSDQNTGSVAAPWRSIQGPIRAGLVPANTTIRVMGTEWAPPTGQMLLNTFGGAAAPPDGLSIVPDLGYRRCTIDGTGRGEGTLLQLWYPEQARRDFELWGFRIRNWKSSSISGGNAPVTIAGNWDGLRFVGLEFVGNGADNGSLDHIYYLGGGLGYGQTTRNLLISHNSVLQPTNQGHLIKIGSGGPGTAGVNGDQNPGANAHDLLIEYNHLEARGWGAVIITGEYQAGNPANTVIANNLIRVDGSSIRNGDGSLSAAMYGGPIYFTTNQPWGIGCDSSFVVRDNAIEITATDRTDWHCIYNLRSPAQVTQSNPHNPTLNNNRLRNASYPANLLAGAAMGSNVAVGTIDASCAATLLTG